MGNKQQETISLTYTYIGDQDWITQTKELDLKEVKNSNLRLQHGNVFLNKASNHLFGPEIKDEDL